MKHTLLFGLFSLLFLGNLGISQAQTTLYKADLTTVGGFEHTSTNAPAAGPQVLDLGNYMLGYDAAPATDGSLNFYRSNGTNIESRDFGGAAYFMSDAIDISTVSNFTIIGIGETIGSGFNSSSEFFQWSYSIDGADFVQGPRFNGAGSLDTPASFNNIPSNSGLSLVVRFDFDMNGGSDGFEINSLEVSGISAAASTQVNFSTTSATVNEGDGTASIDIGITNSDATTPTMVEVALNTGDPADVASYTTQTVTFPAGSSADQTVIFTISDDADVEGDETLVFSLQNATGGDDAIVGTLNTFSLTIEDNDFPPAPTLVFTEISDPADNTNARFVEVYNNGTESIDFSTTPIYISRFVNGASIATASNTEELTSGILAPGAYLVIAASGTNFESQYGFAANELNGGFGVNGDDPFGMYAGTFPNGNLFDVYGVLGTDGSGEPWEYEDSRAVRNDLSVTPKTTWTASEWDISPANAADATPGGGEPITYRYNGAWTPSDPSGVSSIFDLISVDGGTAIFTDDVSARNIEVVVGATLNFGSNNISIANGLNPSGTIIGDEASLNFVGTQEQFIQSGTSFTVENVTLNNPNGLVVNNNGVNITGILTLENGLLNTNGLLTFKSSEGKSAVVSPVVNGSITGNVTIEQFFPATTGRKFRFVSAPVNFDGSIFENWQENGDNATSGLGVQITGGTAVEGYDQSTSNNPSLFRFDNAATDPSTAWTALSSENGDDLTSIAPSAGDAYRLFVRGDRMTSLSSNMPGVTETTMRTTGKLVAGAYPATPIALAGPNLYSLIGNPYQSKVDVQQLLDAATSVVTTEYYQWDPTTNNYVLYEFATPTLPTGSDITENAQPGQSFFVQSDATGNGTLQFQESYKASGSDVTTKNANSQQFITINLANEDQVARGVANDIAIARFDDSFSTSFDTQDSNKLFGMSHSIAWENQGSFYAVNRTKQPEDGDSYELNLFVGVTGDYTFDIVQQGVGSINTYLYDKFMNSYEVLASDATTRITKTIDLDNAGSSAKNRFQIVFSKSTLGVGDEFAFAKAVSLYPNPSQGREIFINNLIQGAPVSIKVYNSLGQEVISTKKSAASGKEPIKGLEGMSIGLYLIQVSQQDKQTTLKLILN